MEDLVSPHPIGVDTFVYPLSGWIIWSIPPSGIENFVYPPIEVVENFVYPPYRSGEFCIPPIEVDKLVYPLSWWRIWRN